MKEMKTKIHVLRTGEVRVSAYLPFGGDDCNIIKALGMNPSLTSPAIRSESRNPDLNNARRYSP